MPLDYRDRNPDFKQKSRFVIYERDKNCCKRCGVANNAVGYWQRTRKGEPPRWVPISGSLLFDEYGRGHYSQAQARRFVRELNALRVDSHEPRWCVVKLQCAHLNWNELDDDWSNLLTMCHACHRHYDSRDNAARREYGETGQHHEQLLLFNDISYARHPDRPRPKKPQHPPKRSYTRRGANGHRPATSPVS